MVLDVVVDEEEDEEEEEEEEEDLEEEDLDLEAAVDGLVFEEEAGCCLLFSSSLM